ncbi:MAG: response regulator [Nitrospirae bacterium]|nr:response regulator [Nitrospirota bacterium]
MVDVFGIPQKNSRGRVLVIDDEADVRKSVTMSLTKSGYEVIEAEDGQQAIGLMNSGDNPLAVDVIICDIRMPKVNGIEAVSYFRAQYPSRPVLVLTGFPDIQLATDLLKQGVVDYLVKPIEREKLAAAVESAMTRSRKAA